MQADLFSRVTLYRTENTTIHHPPPVGPSEGAEHFKNPPFRIKYTEGWLAVWIWEQKIEMPSDDQGTEFYAGVEWA